MRFTGGLDLCLILKTGKAHVAETMEIARERERHTHRDRERQTDKNILRLNKIIAKRIILEL